jgi:hypothetical protein
MPKQREKRCYVYRIFDGHETIYIGKGTGRRLAAQIRRFDASGEKLEECLSDADAFKRERHWISVLMPIENRNGGGSGSYTKHNVPRVPRILRQLMTEKQWAANAKKMQAQLNEIERTGTRRYVAQYLLQKLSELNCELWGLSKVDVNRLREVANGPRC